MKKIKSFDNSSQETLFESSSEQKQKSSKKSRITKDRGSYDDIELLEQIANSPSKDAGYTRAYYSYPAKFQAHLPAALVSLATEIGDLVCDPYCGGGTVGLESMLLNRRFIGYDLSPFAILVSNVKTTKIDPKQIRDTLPEVLNTSNKPSYRIFDDLDIECIGTELANELTCIYSNIRESALGQSYKDFLKLALIHTVKIIGRRDFTDNGDSTASLFQEMLLKSALSPFKNKVERMLEENSTLLRSRYKPKFYCASNHKMKIQDDSVDLIVTSPPYKDLDVEYGLIQLQRPELKRSKRSRVIWNILGVEPVAKNHLCGEKGEAYWTNLLPTLRECIRILKKKKPAFFWIGFKNKDDQDIFCSHLEDQRLKIQRMIQVRLGDDRVASSRSTHHGRDTGMMKRDYLIVTTAL